jgi:hypothetical protein
MQRVLKADVLNPETAPSARAQVARAWDVLEERKRLIRMKPKPKDIDTTLPAQAKITNVRTTSFRELPEHVETPLQLDNGVVPEAAIKDETHKSLQVVDPTLPASKEN